MANFSKMAETAWTWLRSPAGRKVAMAALVALAAGKAGSALIGAGDAATARAAAKRDKGKSPAELAAQKQRRGRGQVDREFFVRLRRLLKIAIPGPLSREAVMLAVLGVFLVFRTWLSIRIAEVNGTIVRAIVDQQFGTFLRRIGVLLSIAVPASAVNSTLKFLGNHLGLNFRRRLVAHFHARYFQPMMYYKVLNLDSRVASPDQALTDAVDQWGKSLSELYSNITKPTLDIILFSRKLAELVGVQGPLAIMGYYFVSGVIIRLISPPFGRLTAEAQRREGELRYVHNRLIMHSEEVAFYNGHKRERAIVNGKFAAVVEHMQLLYRKHLFMGVFDGFLVKYGAVCCGYATLALPVFGPGSEEYLARVSTASNIMEDYIRNSSMLINLAKAIGRWVTSYKDLQRLAGFTAVVSQLDDVMADLEEGRYSRKFVQDTSGDGTGGLPAGYRPGAGQITEAGESIVFEDVPIVTPNGDMLVDHVSFEIQPGMNLMIVGPNGSGKSSLFRILAHLWPAFSGHLSKPAGNALFYVPQKPYLAAGSLRDQVIYPHSTAEMFLNGTTDDDLMALLDKVSLTYIVGREGGWDAVADWADVLSGGEKQRVAFARLLYHRPRFAILDECTSAVSCDVESFMYTYCKEVGITLITISHRPSLWKFHEWKLELDGRGNYNFGRMIIDPSFDDTP